MSDFPKGGDVASTRAWLDKEGFTGIFNNWKADAILGLKDENIMTKVPGDTGEMLCGFLNTARQTTGKKHHLFFFHPSSRCFLPFPDYCHLALLHVANLAFVLHQLSQLVIFMLTISSLVLNLSTVNAQDREVQLNESSPAAKRLKRIQHDCEL